MPVWLSLSLALDEKADHLCKQGVWWVGEGVLR